MHPTLALPLAFGIGVVAGLRSMTAPAIVSWFARLHPQSSTDPLWNFMGSTAMVAIFSVLAVAELVSDKLPKTPSRTKPGPLIARLLMGGLAGATLGVGAGGSLIAAGIVGALGGLAGTFAGYQARTRTVRRLHTADFPIALLEDVVAVGGAVLLASRM